VSNASVVLQKCMGLLLDRVAVCESGHHMSFLILTLCRTQSNAQSPANSLSAVTFASLITGSEGCSCPRSTATHLTLHLLPDIDSSLRGSFLRLTALIVMRLKSSNAAIGVVVVKVKS
jgi:hypothetical protein